MGIVAHELRKCFCGKPFAFACAGSIALSVAAAVQSYSYARYIAFAYEHYSNYTAYVNWMVPNGNAAVCATIFMFAAPVLAVIPFACSGATERNAGYEVQLAVRTCAGRRAAAKGLTVFLSGAAVVAAGLIANFLVLACLLPLGRPVIEDWFVTGIFYDCLFASLLYNAPMAYVVAYTLFDALLMGVWALFVFGLSAFSSNRVILVVAPYALLLVVQEASRGVAQALDINGAAVGLIDFMQGTYFSVMPVPQVIAAVVSLLAVACAALVLVAVPRREVR